MGFGEKDETKTKALFPRLCYSFLTHINMELSEMRVEIIVIL